MAEVTFLEALRQGLWEEMERDDRVRVEVDQATDACVNEPLPAAESALPGVYVDPPAADKLWFKSV
jgi:hypothetical protein